jgi:hypothetical protein
VLDVFHFVLIPSQGSLSRTSSPTSYVCHRDNIDAMIDKSGHVPRDAARLEETPRPIQFPMGKRYRQWLRLYDEIRSGI